MSLFDPTPLKRAKGREESARARLAEFQAGRAALDRSKPNPEDFDAALAHQERVAALDVRIKLAGAAADAASQAVTAAISDAETARQVAEDAAEERLQQQMAKRLVRDFPSLTDQLTSLLRECADNRERLESLNLRRRGAGLPPILPAEDRVRNRPLEIIPAVFETHKVWRRPDGSRPSNFVQNEAGDLFPAEAGCEQVPERVEVKAERIVGGMTPLPLADTVVIPPLRPGDAPIWPAGAYA